MDDPRFSICTITTPNWGLGECIEGWLRHGVPAIGVTRAGLDAYGQREGVRLLKDSGLRVTNYQGIGRYGHDAPPIGEVVDSFMGDLDAAAELGVDCVFVMSGPRGDVLWEEAAKRFTEELRLLLPHAKERGVRLAIEPIHPMRQDLTFINTAKDAYDIVAEVGDPSLGYVFDFLAPVVRAGHPGRNRAVRGVDLQRADQRPQGDDAADARPHRTGRGNRALRRHVPRLGGIGVCRLLRDGDRQPRP